MNFHKRDPALILLTSSGGLLSALITIGTDFPLGHFLASQQHKVLDISNLFLPGIVLGAIVSGCLTIRGYLQGAWRIIAITTVSAAAYFLSFTAAAEFSLHPFGLVPIERIGEVTNLTLVVGGLTGAFTIICGVPLVSNSHQPWRRRVLTALYWTPVGAFLAVVGWALGPSLGVPLWQVIHAMNLTAPTQTLRNAQGMPTHMYALFAIWEAGMGLVLGLVVSGEKSTTAQRGPYNSSTFTGLMHT